MALKKIKTPEFDVDDDLLLLEAEDVMSDSEASGSEAPVSVNKTRATASSQHKYIDYSRALDATQLYLNEIGFSLCSVPRKKCTSHAWRRKAIRPAASA